MTIRHATPDDVPALVAMGLRFHDESPYRVHFPWTAAALEALASSLIANPDALVLIAEAHGQPVGMFGAFCCLHPMSGERIASEVFWWVNPEHRGGGLRLLKAAETWARAQGAARLLMIAPDDAVGRLYTRLGYAPVETSYVREL